MTNIFPILRIIVGVVLYIVRMQTARFIWLSLVLMSLSVIPLFLPSASNFSLMKYIIYQETFSILLCLTILFFNRTYATIFFIFLKVGMAPLGGWLENLIININKIYFFILSIPKIIPIFLLASINFSYLRSRVIILVTISFASIKILMTKNLEIFLIYLGNFSIGFIFVISIYNTFVCYYWILVYLYLNIKIMFDLQNNGMNFTGIFWISALPPSPFFLVKLVVASNLLNNFSFVLLFYFLARIVTFFSTWELSCKSMILKRNTEKNYFHFLIIFIVSLWFML